MIMERIAMLTIERTYKNNSGQHAEQVARFTLTGEICKADNLPHDCGGDIGNLQVKSSKATVCKGTDLQAYLNKDGATSWGYVTADFATMFVMDRAEWVAFVEEFGYVTYESKKNGGAAKIRLREESRKMREWLMAH